MKITGIEIGGYRQFSNINFDFTYPKGHPKEGQPLDKVCFIGQSGTGKTTLLSIIWNFFQIVDDGFYIKSKRHTPAEPVSHYFPFDNILVSCEGDGNSIDFGKIEIPVELDNKTNIIIANSIKFIEKYNLYDFIKSTDKLCLFIKDSISREADAFLFNQKEQPQSFSDFVKTDTQIEQEKSLREKRIDAAGFEKIISFGDMQSIFIWQHLLRDIDNYDNATVGHITNIIQNSPKSKVSEELQKWVDSDPRIQLAEQCLNPILSKFFLEIGDSEKGKVPISLRTKQGFNVPSSLLSTGARQLLATAIPIYKFDTNETVILFDEPERSLFPDIQRILIDYYSSLAPEAQFFFATHSPIIASAFEPCERFILSFNEKGEVECRRGTAPIGDDPNDILRQDFGMSPLMSDAGVEAYQRYLDLATEIINETDKERKMELIAERSILGDNYNFAVTNSNATNY